MLFYSTYEHILSDMSQKLIRKVRDFFKMLSYNTSRYHCVRIFLIKQIVLHVNKQLPLPKINVTFQIMHSAFN